MDIIIRETNARESLVIIDPRTGINFIQDFIGNTGALSDGQFVWDDEQDAYICDQDTFARWARTVEKKMRIGSWVIIRKSDGTPVTEIFEKEIVEKIDRDYYSAVPIGEYLCNLNKQIKQQQQQRQRQQG